MSVTDPTIASPAATEEASERRDRLRQVFRSGTFLIGLAIAVMARMESMPMAFGAGLLIGAINSCVIFCRDEKRCLPNGSSKHWTIWCSSPFVCRKKSAWT